jgi:hypothetical protein
MPSMDDIFSSKKTLRGWSTTRIGIVIGALFLVLIAADSLLIASGQLEIGSILGALIMAFGAYGAWIVFDRFKVEGAKQ